MGRKKAAVTWQDGNTSPYNETYKERAGKSYSDFRTELGLGERHSGENGSEPRESFAANPDAMSDEEIEQRDPTYKGHPQPTAEQVLLEEAKKLLTEKQAAVWQAVMVEEYTTEEAGEVLGVSHQMVSKHLAAARKKITAHLHSNASRIKRD